MEKTLKDLDYYLKLNYEIVIRRLEEEEGGGWLATIPDLPGCMSDGESLEEAVKNVEDAKRAWLATALEAGRDIPEPNREGFSGKFVVRLPKTLHRDLAARAEKENVSLNQMAVYLLAYGLGKTDGVKTKLVIDKSQAYFWSERWQAGEKEAEEDIKAGRLKYFKNAEEAARALTSPDADSGVER